MEDSDHFNKAHFLNQELMSSLQKNPSKSYTHFFFKSFFILLVLVLLPFFPSQAPDFMSSTIFNELWELVLLFVIGIVVSYGLFSRRSVKLDAITCSNIDSSRTYLSGISHVSSFFEDGFQNPYGSYGKKVTQNWNSDESLVFGEDNDYRSLKLQNGFENPHGFDEKLPEAGDSQYFIGEAMAVVANGNNVVDKWDISKSSNGYKPLNLPVRSLRSRNVVTATSYESKNEGGVSASLEGCDGIDKKNKVKIRGLVPINLEEKLKDTVVSSPIRWGSRSGRMEMKEEVNIVKPPSKSLSHVGIEFKCPKLPVRSSVTTSTTVFPEVLCSDMEVFEKEYLQGSFPTASQSSLAPLRSETSVSRSNRKRFSADSSSVATVKKSTDIYLKGCDKNKKEDYLCREQKGLNSLNSDVKLSNIGNGQFIIGSSSKNKINSNDSGKSEKEDFSHFHTKNNGNDLLDADAKPTTSVKAQIDINSFFEMNTRESSKIDFWNFGQSEIDELLHGGNNSTNSSNSDVTLGKGSFSNGSFTKLNVEKSSESNLKRSGKNEKEDLLRRENKGNSLSLNVKPAASLVKKKFRIGSSSEVNAENMLKGVGTSEREDSLHRENSHFDSLNSSVKPTIHVKGRHSIGSSSEMNVKETSENNFNLCKENKLENRGISSLNSDVKPATLVKPLKRGKSVRTIRSNELFMELRENEEAFPTHIGYKVGKKYDKDETGSPKSTCMRAGLENLAADTSRKNVENVYMLDSRLRKTEHAERQISSGTTSVESEKFVKELESIRVSVDKEETTHISDDTYSESDEVDKKADEFIAKFREQMRLQKVASMKELNSW